MKILIADDDPTSLALLAGLARRLGHEVITAVDGEDALAAFAVQAPDLVMLDGRMPVLDGCATTLRLRALTGTRWLPILFVAAESDHAAIAGALDAGADDYLVKPVHPAVLKAKLCAVDRLRTLYGEVEAQKRFLQDYHDRAEDEGRLAAYLMGKLVGAGQPVGDLLQQVVVPLSTYSGDLVAAARAPRGAHHFMLADAVGHGLTAALNLLPIVPSFHAMTAKDFDLDSTVIELNRALRLYVPADRFVAATLISVDPAVRRIKVWNGGNPPVLLFDDTGRVLQRFASRNLALGIVPDAAFAPVVESFDYDEPCQLFACSDGVVDDFGRTAVEGGRQAQIEAMIAQTPPALRLKRLRGVLAARTAEGSADDDMAVILVRCDAAQPAQRPPPRLPARWQHHARFDAADLRELDVVGLLLEVIATAPGAHFHLRGIGTVVAELVANAVDHGVLGLVSAEKDASDGLERYFGERAAALAALAEGGIEVELGLAVRGGRPLLEIAVRDSGPGFRPAARPAAGARARHGRGLALLRSLCAYVEFGAAGNEVRVGYALDDPLPAAGRAAA